MEFNNVKLSEETIKEARKWFHDNCLKCIEEAESGNVFVNDLKTYVKQEKKSAELYLKGYYDDGIWFLQRAYYIQTGESVPLLAQ